MEDRLRLGNQGVNGGLPDLILPFGEGDFGMWRGPTLTDKDRFRGVLLPSELEDTIHTPGDVA